VSRRRSTVAGELLDIPGASAHYGPTPSVFRHLVERHAIPFIELRRRGKKRGRIYFRRSTLDAYFEKLERQSSRGPEAA